MTRSHFSLRTSLLRNVTRRILPSSFLAGAGILSLMGSLYTTTALAQLEPQPTQPQDKPPTPPKLTKPPELLVAENPIYPESAKAAGIEGDVILRITIDAEGSVARVDVVQGVSPELDKAAMVAATFFEFAPAEFDGKPGPVAIEYRMTFKIDEQVVEVDNPDALDPNHTNTNPDANPADPNTNPATNDPNGSINPSKTASKRINLAGIVREKSTKIPLEGVEVTVFIDSLGEKKPDSETNPNTNPSTDPNAIPSLTAYTDAEGKFSFVGVPVGFHRIVFGASGYEPAFIDEKIADKELTKTTIYLEPRQANQFETVVRAKRAQKEVAKIALSREEVRRIPGTFGDPLRVIENLPGLARAPFIGGALIVRGANPQDTGVYFDGVEIPLLYHFGGLTSVVNAEFLEDISFYPGGFGPYYGRATAGIVDVASRDINFDQYRGYAEVDLIDSGFFFAGPVKIDGLPKINFAAAGRRSYVDALIPPVLDIISGPEGQGIVAAPVYWDYQFKIGTSPAKGHDVSLFLFGSDDDLRVVSQGAGLGSDFDLGVHSAFHRLVGRWQWRPFAGVRNIFQPYAGVTTNDLETGSSLGIEGILGVGTLNWGLRNDLRIDLGDIMTISGGLDYQGSTFGVNIDFPIPVEVGSFPRVFPRLTENQSFGSSGVTNAAAFYLEGEINAIPNVKIVPGMRLEFTRIDIFADELEDGTKVDGTAVNYVNYDPRLNVRWNVLNGTTLKGAFGIYRQPPQGNELSSETGNPALEQPRALQAIIGIEQYLTDDINVDMQLYYTGRDLLVQNTSRSVDNGNGNLDPLFLDNGGLGRTFGIELLLRHEISKNFFGWIAYTLSRTEIDLNENRDSFVLADFDQTHILTVVAQYNLPWNITLGGRFRLVSGSPTTLPLGSVHDLDTFDYRRISATARSSRLPAFNQLDLRIDKKWLFDTFSMTTYLDLLNVYNQQNAEGFINDYRFRERQPIPSLPILPVVGLSGEF